MNTDKEIAAFVDRMSSRLSDGKGSRRGRHRAAFIAVRPLVEAALCRGHTMKATWEALSLDGKLSMTYETFRGYCRAMTSSATSAGPAGRVDTRQFRRAAGESPAEVSSSPTASGEQSASRTAEGSAGASDVRSFRHERVPRTAKIYGWSSVKPSPASWLVPQQRGSQDAAANVVTQLAGARFDNAWFTPINVADRRYRVARLRLEAPRNEEPLNVAGSQVHGDATIRGTVQHVVLEAEGSAMLVAGDATVEFAVTCTEEAGELREPVPYALQ